MVLSPIRISLQEQTCTTAWETKPGLSSKRIVSGAWGRFQGLNLTQRIVSGAWGRFQGLNLTQRIVSGAWGRFQGLNLTQRIVSGAWGRFQGLNLTQRIVSGAWGRFQGLNLTQRFCWRVAMRSLGYYIMSQKVCLSICFSRSVC